MKRYYIYEGGYWSKNDKFGYWSDFEDDYSKSMRIKYYKLSGLLMVLIMRLLSPELKPRLVYAKRSKNEN